MTRPALLSRRIFALLAGGILAGVLLVWLAPQLAVFALASWVRDATGRTLSVQHASIHWGRQTTLELDGLRLANAPWGREPWMLAVDRLQLRAPLWELLRGHGVLGALRLDGAALALETRRGEANWRFERPAPFMTFGDGGLPRIDSLELRGVTVRFHDPARESDITGAIAIASGSFGEPGWQIRGQGVLDYKALTFRLQSQGNVLDLALDLGDTTLLARGSPASGGFSVHASGADLRHAFPAIPLPFPSTPAYMFDARVTRDGRNVEVRGLHGFIGDTDVAGELRVSLSSPPVVAGELHSHVLHLRDLKGFVGEPVRGPPPRPGKIFPASPINRQRFFRVILDLDYRADQVADSRIPFSDLSTHVAIARGRLALAPRQIRLADGPASGDATLDVRGEHPVAELRLQLEGSRLSRLVAHLPLLDASRGWLRGRLSLRGAGDSIAELFSASHGEVVLLLRDGALDRRFVDTLGGDVVQLLFNEDGKGTAQLSCAGAVFDVTGGVARANALVLETSKALITGDGDIDLGRERLDLTLAATPKETRPLAAPAPVTVGGTLAKPKVALDTSELAARAAAALTLGALVGPLAALAPFTEQGTGDGQSGCSHLRDAVRGEKG